MKKIFTMFILSVITLVTLTACGGNKSEESEFQDNQFLSDIKKGLEARWEYSDAQDKKKKDLEVKFTIDAEEYKRFVDLELEKSNLRQGACPSCLRELDVVGIVHV